MIDRWEESHLALRFLVVDDTRFMRMMLTDILRKLQHEVAGEADNGERAVALYRELKPDVVFMDISMPGMNGVRALEMIRREDPEAVVIICSANSQQEQIETAMKRGASGYVVKPFKPKQIREVIEQVTGRTGEAPKEPPVAGLRPEWLSFPQHAPGTNRGGDSPAAGSAGQSDDPAGRTPGRDAAERKEAAALVTVMGKAEGAKTEPGAGGAGRPAGEAGEALAASAQADRAPGFAAAAGQPGGAAADAGQAGGAAAVATAADAADAAPDLLSPDFIGNALGFAPEPPASRSAASFERLSGCRWTDGGTDGGAVFLAWHAPGSGELEIACEGGTGGRLRISLDALDRLLAWAREESGRRSPAQVRQAR